MLQVLTNKREHFPEEYGLTFDRRETASDTSSLEPETFRPLGVVVRLRLIGPISAWSASGRNVLPASPKARALLALTAMTGPRPAMRAWLAEQFWSNLPEFDARALLRQEVHRLQDALGPDSDILVATRDHVSFRSGSLWLDTSEVGQATVDRPAALSLLDGELLEDLDGLDPSLDHWLTIARERLRDGARGVAEGLLRTSQTPVEVISAAWRLLHIDRTHEGAWRSLMRAHDELGEIPLACEAFELCRAAMARLRDSLPSVETQALFEGIKSPRVPAAVKVETEHSGRRWPGVGILPLRQTGPTGGDGVHHEMLSEAIKQALARFRWMKVFDTDVTGRPLQPVPGNFGDADFLIDGSIAANGPAPRLTLRLRDQLGGDRIVWARRFDLNPGDPKTAASKIAAEAAAQLEQEVLVAERARLSSQPGDDATGYDLVVRSLPAMRRLDRAAFEQAGIWLTQSITREPEYLPAYSPAALWNLLSISQGWAEDPLTVAAHAEDLVRRLIAMNPVTSRGHGYLGHVIAKLHRAPLDAVPFHDRSLMINPNQPRALSFCAMTQVYIGCDEAALSHYERYKQLLPSDVFGFMCDSKIIQLHVARGENQEAVALGRQVVGTAPLFSEAYKPYLAALGHLGMKREADIARERLARIEPGFSIDKFLETSPLVSASARDKTAEGLRRAGVA